jgi:hypothetical protein
MVISILCYANKPSPRTVIWKASRADRRVYIPGRSDWVCVFLANNDAVQNTNASLHDIVDHPETPCRLPGIPGQTKHQVVSAAGSSSAATVDLCTTLVVTDGLHPRMEINIAHLILAAEDPGFLAAT